MSRERVRRELLARVPALLLGLAPALSRAGDAKPTPKQHSAAIAVSGTVGGVPEAVSFSGQVQIQSHLVRDPDFGRPTVVQLAIDLVDLVGKGVRSGARYVSQAELIDSVEVNSNEVIELTFPFQPESRKGHLAARSASLALTLRFDARSGALLQGSGRVSSIE